MFLKKLELILQIEGVVRLLNPVIKISILIKTLGHKIICYPLTMNIILYS